ncbi:MAG: DUF6894 family protein [Xanthobacteraceae bacterium]
MPLYAFELRDGSRRIEDKTGINLPDRAHALQYAHDVVRELMSCREAETRTWRLDVYEDEGTPVFEIPFASVDATLAYLTPNLRAVMEGWCRGVLSLREAGSAAAVTVRESRALVARSRGKPFLAAAHGQRTIRDT